jgi:hypothetical protein
VTVRLRQASIEVLDETTSKVRVRQASIEVLDATDSKVRLRQTCIEVLAPYRLQLNGSSLDVVDDGPITIVPVAGAMLNCQDAAHDQVADTITDFGFTYNLAALDAYHLHDGQHIVSLLNINLDVAEAAHDLVDSLSWVSETVWRAADVTGDTVHVTNNPGYYADSRQLVEMADLARIGRYVRIKVVGETITYSTDIDRFAISRQLDADRGQQAHTQVFQFAGSSSLTIDPSDVHFSDWLEYPMHPEDKGYWLSWELHTDTLWSYSYWTYQDSSEPVWHNKYALSILSQATDSILRGELAVEPEGCGRSIEGDLENTYYPFGRWAWIEKIEVRGAPATTEGTLTIQPCDHGHVADFFTLGHVITEDFSGYSAGAVSSAFWSIEWYDPYRVATIVEDAGYTGGKALAFYTTFLDQASFLWWQQRFPRYGADDQDVFCRFQLSDAADNTFYPCVVRGMAPTGAAEAEGYCLSVYPTTGKISLRRIDNVNSTTELDSATKTINTGTWYNCRLQASGSTIRGKFWAADSNEPAAWDVSTPDATYPHGLPGIGLYGATGAANAPVVDYFGVGTSGLQALPLGTLDVKDGFHDLVSDNTILTGEALLLSSSYHDHAADGLDLVQTHILAVAAGDHDHLADAFPLSQLHLLAVAACNQDHISDGITLAQLHQLTVAEAAHLLVDDGPLWLQTGLILSTAAGDHLHFADMLDLVQVYGLIVAECYHAHAGPQLTLTTRTDLAVAAADHLHTAQSFPLTSIHQLQTFEAYHLHVAGNIEFAAITVNTDASDHLHFADSLSLTGAHFLAAADAAHDVLSSDVVLGQRHALAVSDSYHTLHGTAAVIPLLVVADTAHLVDSDNVLLAYNLEVAPADHVLADTGLQLALTPAVHASAIAVASDQIALTQQHNLAIGPDALLTSADVFRLCQIGGISVDSAASAMDSGQPELLQEHFLSASAAYHLHAIEVLVLAQDHFLSDNCHSHHNHCADNIRFAALPEIEGAIGFRTVTILRELRSRTPSYTIERRAA